MSLYNTYRPQSFDEIKGNEKIIKSLTSMFSKPESCPHVFLFSGPKGCGKTTFARIIANLLECSEADYNEINSANMRGIDTARDIIRLSGYKPKFGSVMVWVGDEVHKWTNDAQNAMLKILEEPPKHVYYIFCTTDPQKLIAPFKDRCQQFQVNPLTDTEMFGLLRKIVRAEKQELDKEVYDQIILDCLGHPRSAIQVLEQILNLPPEDRLEAAKKAAAEQSEIKALCQALLYGKEVNEVMKILSGIKDQEPETIRRAVLGYMQAVLLGNKPSVRAAFIMEEFMPNTYDVGMPLITYACFKISKTKL